MQIPRARAGNDPLDWHCFELRQPMRRAICALANGLAESVQLAVYGRSPILNEKQSGSWLLIYISSPSSELDPLRALALNKRKRASKTQGTPRATIRAHLCQIIANRARPSLLIAKARAARQLSSSHLLLVRNLARKSLVVKVSSLSSSIDRVRSRHAPESEGAIFSHSSDHLEGLERAE